MSEENLELQLGNEFIRETGCNVFLTGKAGTGKTTFLHNLKFDCTKRLVITAPTGVAAINAGGVTLHSFFQLPFGPYVPGSDFNRKFKFNREKIQLLKSLDLLIIDEISMVRADLLDGVDSVLRRYRRSNLSFGGVQLLLIGDLHQLPPVVKNEDWRILGPHYKTPYFFSSKALAKTELICIELKKIYRQSDNTFIELLNKVRENRLDDNSLERLNRRYETGLQQNEAYKEGYITLCSHNSLADTINETKLGQLRSKEQFFDAEVEGEFPEQAYPTPPTLVLKVGAQVMFMRNDASYEKRYFNGKIGKITRITGDQIWIQCPDDSDEIMVEPATWENIEYDLNQDTMEITQKRAGAFIQYPLKLAWAITIHKSQGLTFDRAIIDAQAAFAHGQVYVALSRCRTLKGLVLGSQLTRSAIKTDTTVLEFSQYASKNLPTKERLEAAKIRYQQGLLLDCFDFTRMQTLLRRVMNVEENSGGLLRVLGAGNLSELQQETSTVVTRVGNNFSNQLQTLFNNEVQPSKDPTILERLLKASVYFQKEIDRLLLKSVPELQLETDNKDLRKQAKKSITLLQEEVAVKWAAIKCFETGFDSAAYLKAISSAEIIESNKKQSKSSKVSVTYSETDIEHPHLYHTLKQWRTKKAKNENLTPFQVIHLKTLIQIAVNLPNSTTTLKQIKGIGDKLAARYGEELVEMVLEYQKKHGIEQSHSLPSQQELPLSEPEKKQKTNKSSHLESYELFQQGLPPEQIAEQRGLTKKTIEKHLSFFIASGELGLEKLVSPEKQTRIQEQFEVSRSSRLKEIKEALGPDYSYSEIRFVQAYLEYRSA